MERKQTGKNGKKKSAKKKTERKEPETKVVEPMEPGEPGVPAVRESQQAMVPVPIGGKDPVDQVKARVAMIDRLYKEVLKEGLHYGKIPGTDKPTLLKPGAEKIVTMFQLAPKTTTEKEWLTNGHLNVDATVSLYTPDGVFVASGQGSCSTLESKYRYRYADGEILGPVPREYWQSGKDRGTWDNSLLHGGYPKKTEDKGWVIMKRGKKVENEDIADQYNTVKKMAIKRALVGATLMLGASDRFTHDMEDFKKDKGEDNGGSGKGNKNGGGSSGAQQQQKPPQGSGTQGPGENRKLSLDIAFNNVNAGGKFKGKTFGECPNWYLEWLALNCDTPEAVADVLNQKLINAMMQLEKDLGIDDVYVQGKMQELFKIKEWSDLKYEQKKEIHQILAKELKAKKGTPNG